MNPVTTTKADYYNVRMGRRHILVHKDFLRYDSEDLCENECFDGVRGPFRKLSSSDFAGVFDCKIAFSGRRIDLCLKHYLYRSPWDFIKHLFRPSRAMRAFKASLMLEENGLGCPGVVAVGDFRYGFFYRKPFLITYMLQDTKAVYVHLYDSFKKQGSDCLREKRHFLSSLGATIGKMHAAGIFHGDLRAGNVFAKEQDGKWGFFFLDNERTKKYRQLPKRLQEKNLVQINMINDSLSRTDRLRFFKSYLKHYPMAENDRKKTIKQVALRTDYRLRRKNWD